MKKLIIISIIVLIVLYLVYYYLNNKPAKNNDDTTNVNESTNSSQSNSWQEGWGVFGTGSQNSSSNTTTTTTPFSWTAAQLSDFQRKAMVYRSFNNCANSKVLTNSQKRQCNEASTAGYVPRLTGNSANDSMLRDYAQQWRTAVCFLSKLNNAQIRDCKDKSGWNNINW